MDVSVLQILFTVHFGFPYDLFISPVHNIHTLQVMYFY
jgi:hypothetical protein